MPWPMVHFAIAVNVTSSNPSSNFLLGSIAPDAIHVRENATRKEKGITHLISDEVTFPSIERLRRFCLDYLDQKSEADWKQYILGYVAHIYADLRWTETVYVDFENKYQGDKSEIRKVYNREVSQLEFILLRTEDWAQRIIHSLQSSNAYTIEPFLTQSEVNKYRDLKLEWLQNEINDPMIIPEYITEDILKKFIITTSEELSELFGEWGINRNDWDSIINPYTWCRLF